ncbi:MAG TPA: ABC transporter permease subunit [Sinomonas sp.]|nr:ABC transporter permease subunit [Sinomonas sp.]
MNGFAAFALKEVREIVRTWRIWVLPGIVLFFAVTGPILARYTPQILGAVVSDQIPGLNLPTPTAVDAYAQWMKNLSQIVLFTVIISYGGLVSGEVRSGTAALVLTKPLSRAAFVVAKAVVHGIFLVVAVLAGTLVTWGVTAVFFDGAPAGPLWSGTLVWLVFGVLFVALMALLSVVLRSAAGAAGIGIAVYAVLSAAALWKPLGRYSPAALTPQAASLAAGQEADVLWPVLTGLILAAVLVAAAALSFRRQDL